MTLVAPKLKVSPPTGSILPGRGFYQLEDDSLYVVLAGYPEPARFFSSIESDIVRFDLDLKGRLMTIEIDLPRREWPVNGPIAYPMRATEADIRWTDFRQSMTRPALATDTKQQNLLLRFSNERPVASHFLADHVLCQIDASQSLIALWITDIVDDVAGAELRHFRQLSRSG